MARPVLIVFARSPAIGRGKSRLAKDVGAVEAWRLYRTMSAGALRRLRSSRWRIVLCLDGKLRDPQWPKLEIEPQGGGDLGDRMSRAVRRHARCSVVVVGTDVPDLSRAHVAAALGRLRDGRVVLGPSADGGFWLLAVAPRQAAALRLDDIRWSSSHTLDDVVERTQRPVALLQTLVDIDDGAALAAWRARQAGQHRRRVARTSNPASIASPGATAPAAPTRPFQDAVSGGAFNAK